MAFAGNSYHKIAGKTTLDPDQESSWKKSKAFSVGGPYGTYSVELAEPPMISTSAIPMLGVTGIGKRKEQKNR